MTMPKFKPVATAMVNMYGTRWMHWKVDLPHGTELHPADQLTEAYEAGKRDAIPEGWVLVPKEPTPEMWAEGVAFTTVGETDLAYKTRLAALVAKAGEKMREKCAKHLEDDHEGEIIVPGRGYYDQYGDAQSTLDNAVKAIRALPPVTLEDLK